MPTLRNNPYQNRSSLSRRVFRSNNGYLRSRNRRRTSSQATIPTQIVIGTIAAVVTFILTTVLIHSSAYLFRNQHRLSTTAILQDFVILLAHPYAVEAYALLNMGTMMKAFLLGTLVFILWMVFLDAFLAEPYPRRARAIREGRLRIPPPGIGRPASASNAEPLTQEDILWKVRPPPETGWFKKLALRFGANLIRFDSIIKGEEPPFCLCPKGGQCVLEAYYKEPGKSGEKKVGRFGISTVRGPPAPPIDQSAEELFGIQLNGRSVGTAAIIYMFVEPLYRKRDIGKLAWDVISVIHANQGVDFTILVADDDGSGKLVEWYENLGFKRAPKLQPLLGSVNKEFGVAMMAPTSRSITPAVRLKWW